MGNFVSGASHVGDTLSARPGENCTKIQRDLETEKKREKSKKAKKRGSRGDNCITQRSKCSLNVDCIFGTCLHKRHVVIQCKALH
jgi:NAD(P)H-hydrate repair Nnr-like enzyme with NAD(P)H-hydrate epimerase domain